MRNPERIDELLDELKKQWKENPDWRFYQLLTNLGLYNQYLGDHWFIEDDKLINVLKKNVEEANEDSSD